MPCLLSSLLNVFLLLTPPPFLHPSLSPVGTTIEGVTKSERVRRKMRVEGGTGSLFKRESLVAADKPVPIPMEERDEAQRGGK
jgi:hypothetical protein